MPVALDFKRSVQAFGGDSMASPIPASNEPVDLGCCWGARVGDTETAPSLYGPGCPDFTGLIQSNAFNLIRYPRSQWLGKMTAPRRGCA